MQGPGKCRNTRQAGSNLRHQIDKADCRDDGSTGVPFRFAGAVAIGRAIRGSRLRDVVS